MPVLLTAPVRLTGPALLTSPAMDELRHVTVSAPGADIHAVVAGEGTPVVMCHGFPGLWYSWRHQLPALAAAGWQGVALDVRGYGGSSAPAAVGDYDHEHAAADLVAVLDHLGAERGVFVGHDFGGPLVWSMPLRHAERVAAVAVLSVAYDPRRPKRRPSEAFGAMAREHFLHLDYFQTPGVAEAELDANARGFLTRLFWALSGSYHYMDIWQNEPRGPGYLGVLPEPPTPPPWSWLSPAELDFYVDEYERTGFRGGLSWYRAIDLNWERNAELAGRPVEVPALFAAGANDTVVEMGGDGALDLMRAHVPDLRVCELVPGAGHWVQQEAPERVNELLIGFLSGL